MQVIRAELYDGSIVYTDQVDSENLRRLFQLTCGAYRATVMDLKDEDYYRIPVMPLPFVPACPAITMTGDPQDVLQPGDKVIVEIQAVMNGTRRPVVSRWGGE